MGKPRGHGGDGHIETLGRWPSVHYQSTRICWWAGTCHGTQQKDSTLVTSDTEGEAGDKYLVIQVEEAWLITFLQRYSPFGELVRIKSTSVEVFKFILVVFGYYNENVDTI